MHTNGAHQWLTVDVGANLQRCKGKNAIVCEECLAVGNRPVKLLLPPNALMEQALLAARSTTLRWCTDKGHDCRTSLCHCTTDWEAKRFARVSLFIDGESVDIGKTLEAPDRYNLSAQILETSNWPTSTL